MVSDAAAERRVRMIDAAVRLASAGGYDGVQMRQVALGANVALGTLYRHFPSKVHLLVAALVRELERLQDRIDRAILRGTTPYVLLMVVVGAISRSLQRDVRVTEAMTRALVFADSSVSVEVEAVNDLIDTMFAHALSNAEPGERQLAIAHVIGDVWLSNLVAWVNRRVTAADVSTRLELTVGLLLGHRDAGAF